MVPIGLVEFAIPASQDAENVGGNLPEILVSGVVTEATVVTLDFAGSVATAGIDFTINSTTINIPAGTYDGSSAASRFTVPITIINDTVVEPNEDITITIDSVTSAATSSPSTTLQTGDIQCVGTPLTSSTYTIVDAEAEIDITSSVNGAIADAGTDAQGTQTAGTAQTITYTIENDGTDTLTLGGTPTVSGETNIDGAVVVTAPASLSLAPGATTTFTVTYTPENAGAFDFDIDVLSNDANESPYDIAVSGTADGEAEIDITSSVNGAVADAGTDAQGTQTAGTAQTITYTIENDGTDTLTLTGTPTVSGETNIDGAVVVTAPASLSLAPGATTTFTVTYTPENAGAFDFDIDVLSNDANESPYDIVVAGTADPVVDVEAVEKVLSDDLFQTTTMLSRNASNVARRAADRLRRTNGQACGEEINDLLQDSPVKFATDSFVIDGRNNALLDRVTEILKQCGNAKFLIAGHTDSDASDGYNIVLSQNRVDRVLDALVRRGVAGQRLQARGFGESRPVASNATEDGKALNRRVEFILLDEVAETEHACGEENQLHRGVEGNANDQGARVNGNFASSGYNCVTGAYSETWGALNVTHDDTRGTLGMATFGMSRETQTDGTLRGRFVEGYLSKNNVDTDEATGTITGVGIHAGLYGAHGTDGGLILSYYGSAAVGQHSFDLNAGIDVDGNYTYAGVFAGAAVGGERELGTLTVKPRTGIDLAYAQTIGSKISVPDTDLDIDPATYARGFVEVEFVQTTDNGTFAFAPRLFCETNKDEDTDACGFGGTFDYDTVQTGDGTQWSVGFDYETINDRQSASVDISRTRKIFDGLGVSQSSLGATAGGALQASQTVEFTW